MDVREHTTGSDGYRAQELVELLVVADSELDVAWDDAALLVVASSVASELEDLSAEVLEDRSEVHRSASANTGGVASLLEVAAYARHRELKSSLSRLGGDLGAALATAAFSFSRHVDK